MTKENSKKAIEIEKQLNIPLTGNDQVHFNTESGLHIATGYKCVVIGDRGAYVEFSPQQIVKENLHIPKQRHVYFTEWRSKDESNVMVYDQRRTVKYADYKIGLFYICPSDLYVKGSHVMN